MGSRWGAIHSRLLDAHERLSQHCVELFTTVCRESFTQRGYACKGARGGHRLHRMRPFCVAGGTAMHVAFQNAPPKPRT